MTDRLSSMKFYTKNIGAHKTPKNHKKKQKNHKKRGNGKEQTNGVNTMVIMEMEKMIIT